MSYHETIPQKVVDAVGGEEIEIVYLGKYKDEYAFHAFNNDKKTGFPTICLYNGKGTKVIDGFDAMDILASFIKD